MTVKSVGTTSMDKKSVLGFNNNIFESDSFQYASMHAVVQAAPLPPPISTGHRRETAKRAISTEQ